MNLLDVFGNKVFLKGIVFSWLILTASSAFAAPSIFSYQGRILGSNGQPLEYAAVSFEFTVTSPDGTCVLYKEQRDSIDMRNSKGMFDTPIGSGTKSYPAAPSFTLLDAFNNGAVLNCSGGGTYTPAADDGRRLRVQFFDGSGWRLISPDSVIRSVPYAGHAATAAKLGNKTAADFVSRPAVCTAGQVITFDGTNFNCAAGGGGGSGTVTSVATGAGLTGGPITATGTISLAPIADKNILANISGGAAAPTAITLSALIDSAISNTQGSVLYRNNSGWVALPPGTSGHFLQTQGAAANPQWAAPAVGSTAVGGDLSGNLPNPTVVKIQGRAIDATAPTNGQVLIWDNGATTWKAQHVRMEDVRNAWGGTQMIPSSTCTASQAMVWSVITDRFTCQNISITETDPKVGANTTNYLSKWDGSALVASGVFENGGNVGIGTVTPQSKLDVNGIIRATDICDENGANCKDISSGWGAGGDIDGIVTNAGSGLSGGTASGTATLSVLTDASTIEVNGSNQLQIKDGGVTNAKIVGMAVNKITSGAGLYLTYAPNNVACNNGEVLKKTANGWECGVDSSYTSPLTTKGDIYIRNGTVDTRLPVGADGKVLKADSSQASGLVWGDVTATDIASLSTTGIVQRDGAGSYSTVTVNSPLTYSAGALGLDVTSFGDVKLDGNTVTGTMTVGTNSAHDLALETGGAAKMTIQNSTGNVGIGVTSPGYPLTIRAATGTGLALENSSSGNKQWRIAGTGNNLNFTEAGIGHHFVLAAGGNIGVGTESPGASVEVRRAGDASVKVVKTGESALYLSAKTGVTEINTEGSNSEPLTFKFNATERVRFTAAGSVGIGTTAPATPLEVVNSAGTLLSLYKTANSGSLVTSFNMQNSSAAKYEYGRLNFTISDNTAGSEDASFLVQIPRNGAMQTRLAVDYNGHIGVGTAAPTYALSFMGSNGDKVVGIERNTNTGAGLNMTLQAGQPRTVDADTNGGTLYLNGGSATGTGTSKIELRTAGGGTTGTADHSPQTRMTILGDGNVGVGTTSPGAKLEVAGQVKITGGTPGAGKVLTSDAAGLATWETPSTSGGTVTSVTASTGIVTSPGAGITTTGTIAVDVGTGAGQIPQLDGSGKLNTNVIPSSVVTTSTTLGGDLSGTLPNPTVAKVQGRAVASTAPSDGQVMLWDNGNTTWTPQYVRMQDIRNAWGGTQMIPATACAANESMVWSAVTDRFTCQAIGSLNASTITAGIIATARLGSGTADNTTYLRGDGTWATVSVTESDPKVGANTADYLSKWNGSALVASAVFENSGNVGIGTASPGYALDVVGDIRHSGVIRFGTSGAYINQNGMTRFAAGSAATPSVSNKDDTDTGMFFLGTNELGLGTGGTERVRIDASGEVGIGTTAPSSPLHVYSTNLLAATIETQSDSNEPQLALQRSRDNAGAAEVLVADDPLGNILFRGFNGASQSTAARIGAIASENWSGGSRGTHLVFYTNQNSTSTMAEKMRLTSAGYLGLGITVPGANLHVADTVSSGTPMVRVSGSGGAIVANIGDSSATAGIESGFMSLSYEGTTKAYVNANGATYFNGGDVGIGTNSPWGPLDVVKDGGSATVFVRSFGGTAGVQTARANGTVASSVYVSANDKMAQFTAVDGKSAAGEAGLNIFASETHTASAQGMYVTLNTVANGSTTSSERVRVTAAGDVGIGQNNPTMRLEVHDNVASDFTAMISNASATGHGLYVNAGPTSGTGTIPFQVTSYDGSANHFYVNSDGGYYFRGSAISTKESKRDIASFDENAQSLLESIQVVKYRYKVDSDERAERIGFLANDENHVYDDRLTNNKRGFATDTIVGVMIKAFQEVYQKIDHLITEATSQSERINKLEAENAELKARLDRIEKAMAEPQK